MENPRSPLLQDRFLAYIGMAADMCASQYQSQRSQPAPAYLPPKSSG